VLQIGKMVIQEAVTPCLFEVPR